ncbi:MAG: NTP transferase domain-containing protein [Candidatus Aquilonibacter sp.]
MLTVVVLAAGQSARFGSQKLLHPLEQNDTLLARAVRAAGDYDTVVVCSDETLPVAQALGAEAILNREPERGMAHSLRLANAAIAPDRAIVVLPGDLLLIEPQHLAAVAAEANGVDVAFPQREDETPGHPVYFSARARAYIEELRDNEPIAHVRDRAGLAQRVLTIDAAWPYRDVDRPGDL